MQGQLDSFRNYLQNVGWGELFCLMTPTWPTMFLLRNFPKYIRSIFQLKKQGNRKNKKPWISNSLYRRIKKTDRLYKAFISSRDRSDFVEYKKFRNKLNSDIRSAKIRYHAEMCESCSSRTDVLWKKLSAVMNPSSSTRTQHHFEWQRN